MLLTLQPTKYFDMAANEKQFSLFIRGLIKFTKLNFIMKLLEMEKERANPSKLHPEFFT
jgi:hypothetical protein